MPLPAPPPAVVGLADFPALARVCQRLRLSLADVDAHMSVDEVLDEVDLQHYLYDCDCEPSPPPAPSTAGGTRRHGGG